MMPPDRFAILALLRNGLSPRLIAALTDSFKLSLIARSNITVELFLVSLYKSSPQELATFFTDPQPLENLLQQLSVIDVAPVEIASAQTPGSGTRGYHSTLDQSLVDLLSQAATAATKTGARADIEDFMRVLRNDSPAVALLRNERGLTLKNPSS